MYTTYNGNHNTYMLMSRRFELRDEERSLPFQSSCLVRFDFNVCWLRTNGVNTNGAAAKVTFFFGKKVRPVMRQVVQRLGNNRYIVTRQVVYRLQK